MKRYIPALLLLCSFTMVDRAGQAQEPQKSAGAVQKATIAETVYRPAATKPMSANADLLRAPVTGRPTIATATRAFNDKNFVDALSQFQHLDKNGMCCDIVHYYIARCYQQMCQVARAQQNYAWVIERSKDPLLRNYAETASAQLSHYSKNRTYEGQGNNFIGFTPSRSRGAAVMRGG